MFKVMLCSGGLPTFVSGRSKEPCPIFLYIYVIKIKTYVEESEENIASKHCKFFYKLLPVEG